MQKMKMMILMKKLSNSIKNKIAKINWFDFFIHFMILFIYALILATFVLLAIHSNELHENYNGMQGPTIIAPKIYIITETLIPTVEPILTPTPKKNLDVIL